jgi:hypothetical protein
MLQLLRERTTLVSPRVCRFAMFVCSLQLFLFLPCTAEIKPYRILLVISDQWKDPRSFLVSGGGEFQTMVTLFKSWGIPFDILRLDQTIMDASHFADFHGRARYGAIVWDAPGAISASDEALVREAVEKLHISLVAFGNRIQQPEIQRLLGIRYKAEHMHSSHPMAEPQSFILRGLGPDLYEQGPAAVAMKRPQVELVEARALASAAGWPQITERELGEDTRAIWIGGDVDQMLLYQSIRTALRRAITEAIGYSLVKTWTHDIVLTMDDLGNAQNSWLEHWHYPALSQQEIRRYLIEPLKAHHAVLSINTVPGFVDDAKGRIVPTWQQQFIDGFGAKQDYVSTKKGLDEGIAAGVFEIESHGWTHMQPDLTSEPGPWWGSPLDGERAEMGWYREFYDVRRGREIPAAEQKFHMQKSAEWLKEEFGFLPLEFSTGGNGVSRSPENNTWRLAAEVGYGYYGGYLGKDLAVEGRADSNADFGGTDDVPLLLPAPPDGHDRGVTRDPTGFAKVFDKYPDHHFIGLDEYIGYQHADIKTSSANNGLEFDLTYDPHYCRALIAKGSTWSLHLSDWLRSKVKSPGIWVDGKSAGVAGAEWTSVSLTSGSQTHTIELR